MRRSFGTGKYNLLILTKTLEDLDVPPALLVIRLASGPNLPGSDISDFLQI